MTDSPNRTPSDLHAGAPPAAPGSLLHSLDIRVIVSSKDRVVATMPVGPLTLTPHGRLHGGASVALAETVASIATSLHTERGRQIAVGIEINANHLRGVAEGCVVAEALPLHRGRGTHVWEIMIRDDNGALVCASRCTLAIVPLPGAPAAG